MGGTRVHADPLPESPVFSADFRADLANLVRWRRDVRNFRRAPVPPEVLHACLRLAMQAPSVGHAQPGRFVLVESDAVRQAIRANFEAANRDASGGYQDERRALYARLKLAGLDDAPVHIAVLCDEGAATGHGLGRATMPEMLRYSTVCAVHTFWLAARAAGLGVGWVSILDPVAALESLRAPAGHCLIAYLCVGWPQASDDTPALERAGWENRLEPQSLVWTC